MEFHGEAHDLEPMGMSFAGTLRLGNRNGLRQDDALFATFLALNATTCAKRSARFLGCVSFGFATGVQGAVLMSGLSASAELIVPDQHDMLCLCYALPCFEPKGFRELDRTSRRVLLQANKMGDKRDALILLFVLRFIAIGEERQHWSVYSLQQFCS